MRILLETERLIIRYFSEADTDNLFRLDSDPEVMRYINGGKPSQYDFIKNVYLPRFLEYYRKYDHYGAWAVLKKSTQDFIGWLIFRPVLEFQFARDLNLAQEGEIELGYRLQKADWGKGYATEMSQAILNKGFKEWNVSKVCALALVENKASIRVMEKVGLTFEREFSFTEQQLPMFQPLVRKAVKYSMENRELIINYEL